MKLYQIILIFICHIFKKFRKIIKFSNANLYFLLHNFIIKLLQNYNNNIIKLFIYILYVNYFRDINI